MNDVLVAGLPLAAACGVVVEICKAFGLPTKIAALVSIGLGIAVMGFLLGWSFDTVIGGLMAGATAAGVYSGGKKLFETTGE